MLGGPSAEREVSLRSGAAVANALRSLGHHVTELDPQPGFWTLPAPTDLVFLALHGSYGEDGTVQAELEQLGVPYTGCGPEASRIAFDKVLTKKRCLEASVPTPRFTVFTAPQPAARASSAAPPASIAPALPADWSPPVVLKPVCQGSSVGLQMVDRAEDFPAALTRAFQHGDQVLMEERIIGRETTVGILGTHALPLVEIRVKKGSFDYNNKYTPGASEHLCPAAFDSSTTQAIQSAALGAFRAIGGRDFARVDVMVRPDGSPMVLEVNTLPGMTELSVLPDAAAAAGLTYAQLCQRMIDMALQRAAEQNDGLV